MVLSRKKLLDSIKKFDTKERMESLYPILNTSEISINYMILSFIHALEICVDLFDGFTFKIDKNLNIEKFTKLKSLVEKYGVGFSDKYKEQLVAFLYLFSSQDRQLDSFLIETSYKFIEELKNYFKLEITNEDLYRLLFNKVYLSLFKFENNILKISNAKRDVNQIMILEKLDKFLDDYSYKIHIADKYVIAFILKTIIIEENIISIKNVLLLLQDASIDKKSAFKIALKRSIPAVNFDIEPILFYQKNIAILKKNYDIIIADSNIAYESITIESYNNIKIYEILEDYALKKGLNK